MQIVTYVTSKKSTNGIPPPLRSYFIHYMVFWGYMYIRIKDVKLRMIVTGRMGFIVLQPRYLRYLIVASNAIVQAQK